MAGSDLSVENSQALRLIQALVGAVSKNFRRVTLEVEESRISLWFLLEHESSADREEIDDIVFEYEALQDGYVDIEVNVLVDQRDVADIDLPGRAVFGRRE